MTPPSTGASQRQLMFDVRPPACLTLGRVSLITSSPSKIAQGHALVCATIEAGGMKCRPRGHRHNGARPEGGYP